MGFKSSRHNPKLAKDRVCCLALHGKLEGPAGAWLLGKALEAWKAMISWPWFNIIGTLWTLLTAMFATLIFSNSNGYWYTCTYISMYWVVYLYIYVCICIYHHVYIKHVHTCKYIYIYTHTFSFANFHLGRLLAGWLSLSQWLWEEPEHSMWPKPKDPTANGGMDTTDVKRRALLAESSAWWL